MPSATTSGSDAKGNGTASRRGGATPQAGNQARWTPEQKAAVLRVKACNPTDYYAILDLTALKPPAKCTASDVKKAYRKLSLLTHPDKNGHEHAHVAFQMVSKAYLVLSDEGKKDIYDRSGRDPDSRFGGEGGSGGGGAPSANPFAGFAGARREGGWEAEITPEEMFNRFFGGGGGRGFGAFGGPGMFDNGGSPFVFNMGGGPGIRVHQFGGARPRRRPRPENAPPEAPATVRQMVTNLLPLLILILLPLLSSLFSSSDGPEKPGMYFPPNTAETHHSPSGVTAQSPFAAFKLGKTPYTYGRVTKRWGVEYYLDPREVKDFTPRNFMDLDRKAEDRYSRLLNLECRNMEAERDRLINEANGLLGIFVDQKKLDKASKLDTSACRRLHALGYR